MTTSATRLKQAREGPGDRHDHIERTVEEIARLEGRDRDQMGLSDHVANAVTAFSGSMIFVWLHVAWFGGWIGLSLAGIVTFDEFPFGLLTMIVSLEAIFLSTFVLISQNRQSIRADRRAKVDLEINLIAEQEITKLIELVADIHESLGLVDANDGELQAMKDRTRIKELADAADQADAPGAAATPAEPRDSE